MGWKEYELELLRDKNDNVVIICSIENMDPMEFTLEFHYSCAGNDFIGYHIQKMRDYAILMMRSIGNLLEDVTCSCPPDKEDIVAIEINPRVSRSSSISIKSNGLSYCKIASKLALGYNLDELQNKLQINFGFIRTNIGLCNCKKYHVGTLINLKELTEHWDFK
jgi:carbamoyl-phosphate synthase large subunit